VPVAGAAPGVGLNAGALLEVCRRGRGHPGWDFQPTLQVIDMRSMAFGGHGGQKMMLVLSDSQYFVLAVATAEVEARMQEPGGVDLNSFVQLVAWQVDADRLRQQKHIILTVHELRHVARCPEQYGKPESIPLQLVDFGTPASAPVAPQHHHQQPPPQQHFQQQPQPAHQYFQQQPQPAQQHFQQQPPPQQQHFQQTPQQLQPPQQRELPPTHWPPQQQQQQQQQQQPPSAVSAPPAQRPADEEGSGETMREQLRLLKDKDHRCVILTRRIQYLGFSASTELENHFKAFGPVHHVLVPRSHVKSSYLPTGSRRRQATVRQRPAHLGFVIMDSAAGAEAAFAAGAEHAIGGNTIILEPFDEARWRAGAEEQRGPP